MKQLRGIELKRFNKQHKRSKDIVLILENIQYAVNVANLFRTADAAGIQKIILTGISHKPPFGKDLTKASRNKEKSVQWEYYETTTQILNKFKKEGYKTIGIEITDESIDYREFDFGSKICLIAGNETYGITRNTLEKLDACVYIPMLGKGASLNVSMATGIVIFKVIES